ncbi:MAG: diacylglycerol/lipid kinase family protein [bacterium]
MNILLIYNPHAGNGRAKKRLPEIETYLQGLKIQYKLLLTEYSGHAAELVQSTQLTQFDAIVASGGDGTLNEVINGYYQNPQKFKQKLPPVALIPNGTGNAFMRELGFETGDWKTAIDRILLNQSRRIDVLCYKSQNKKSYSINMIGVGLVSDIAQQAIPLKWLGGFAYTLATLIKMVFLNSQLFHLTEGKQSRDQAGIFIEIANSRYTGSSFLMAPDAKIDDGLMDIVLLKPISRLRLLRLFTSIYNGSHIGFEEVISWKSSQITVTEQRPGKILVDGELLTQSPVEICCLKQDIDFIF